MFLFLQGLKADVTTLYLKFAGDIEFNVVMIKYALTKCENGFLTLFLPLSWLALFPLHNSKYSFKVPG